MKKVNVKLENCYGIRKLEHSFDFSDENVFAIYVPNGVMKTSFARTFNDVCKNKETKDMIFTNRETICEIKNEIGASLSAEEIFVIESYDKEYQSQKVSTLLVNKELRKEYEAIHEAIEQKKQDLLKNLKKPSGFKKEQDIEETLSQDISNKKDFFIALKRVKEEVNDYAKNSKGFENIQYTSVFNDKTVELLKDKTFWNDLSEYISTYNKLLDSSTFFKKGVFNHNNAADIAKRLKENGWFKASHSVNIKIDGMEKKISNEEELEETIKNEKESIMENRELRSAFEKLDKTLIKNKETKDFRDYVEAHKEILPELKDIEAFKEKLWIAYLSQNKAEYENILNLYDENEEKLQKIVDEAQKQSTKWQEVINEFNERFSVPFKLKITNKSDVILSDKVDPCIEFEFTDGEKEKPVAVDKELLLYVLSQGEKRALYILNIIFEVKARQELKQPTLYVIDDIADSFDYKNKYAIIEYLRDIAKIDGFNLIIMTHNFDFYRNVSISLDIKRENRLHAVKYVDKITLEKDKYQKCPFITWKEFKDAKHGIAAIPFVRELAKLGGKCPDVFKKLTGLLHQKPRTAEITMEDLPDIFKEIIGDIPDSANFFQSSESVKEKIYKLAGAICAEDNSQKMELEDKVILSMAIRLEAEKFMIEKIDDIEFVKGITNNQTRELVEKFKKKFPDKKEAIRLMDKVILMTPESIHINSFMYEPILDMSNEYLKRLYEEVKNLELK